MKYHTLSGMSAVNLAKFWRKILRIKLSFLTDNLTQTQLKTAQKLIRSVERGFLYNTHASYLLCLRSAVKGRKNRTAQFRLHFFDLWFQSIQRTNSCGFPHAIFPHLYSFMDCKYQAEINGKKYYQKIK